MSQLQNGLLPGARLRPGMSHRPILRRTIQMWVGSAYPGLLRVVWAGVPFCGVVRCAPCSTTGWGRAGRGVSCVNEEQGTRAQDYLTRTRRAPMTEARRSGSPPSKRADRVNMASWKKSPPRTPRTVPADGPWGSVDGSSGTTNLGST